MKNIKVQILNPFVLDDTIKMMAIGARLTQHGHKIKSYDDFLELYNKPISETLQKSLITLPHPTLQHFTKINIVVIGASRRFLAQITRHQENVKFMSASLQYSNYDEDTDFVVPYEFNEKQTEQYYEQAKHCLKLYKDLQTDGVSNDETGYIMPQGMRNVIIISATLFELKHMIAQRICRRNSTEMRYVMLKIWEQLYELSPILFSAGTTGCWCMQGHCQEGKMTCGEIIWQRTPTEILKKDFPNIEMEVTK